MVDWVNAANKRVLKDLDLEFVSVIKLEQLVKRLSEKIPTLDDDMIGSPTCQEKDD